YERRMDFKPHATGEVFDEPHSYSVPIEEPPVSRRQAEDLESTLSALDGDFEDLLDPRGRRPAGKSRPLPGLPTPRTGEQPVVAKHTVARKQPTSPQQRAVTDDGVLIDF